MNYTEGAGTAYTAGAAVMYSTGAGAAYTAGAGAMYTPLALAQRTRLELGRRTHPLPLAPHILLALARRNSLLAKPLVLERCTPPLSLVGRLCFA